jgi:NAD-dependent deacetylase
MIEIDSARQWLGTAKRVAALTGAGISAESGVPVFRGPGGLWRQHRAEDLATPEAFARDPRLVWEWYDWRRAQVAEAAPNPAHYALVKLEQTVPEFTLITQNVDGLHDRAGSRHALKLHGDLWWLRCSGCQERIHNTEIPLTELPPRCKCGALLRPDVVWFGEALDAEVLRMASQTAAQAQVFLVIGTSALVQPAASLPFAALEQGARVIEVNPRPTALSPHADIHLAGPAGEWLPRLVAKGQHT